jgi:hypothetical protein
MRQIYIKKDESRRGMSSEVDNILDIVSGAIYELAKIKNSVDDGYEINPKILSETLLEIITDLEKSGEQ